MPKQSAQGTWIALLLLIIYAFIILTPGEALSDNGASWPYHSRATAPQYEKVERACGVLPAGLPSHLWQHVLDVEVNRHVQQLGEVRCVQGLACCARM
jgi:hypothetical protein